MKINILFFAFLLAVIGCVPNPNKLAEESTEEMAQDTNENKTRLQSLNILVVITL